jgi:S-formylglutathione hydrolase FrmB
LRWSLLLLLSGCGFFYAPDIPTYETFDGTVYSATLKKHIPYWLTWPKERTGETLPVVYFLHGRGNSRHMFRDLGGVGVVQRYTANNGIPLAVVGLTGAVNFKDTYWVDGVNNKTPWATIVLRELIPQIEDIHNLGGKIENRVIAGISMGGHGAYQLALNGPNMFRCVAGHSLGIRSYATMNKEFPGLFGNPLQFAARDPLSLLTRYQSKSQVPFRHAWVDMGGADEPYFLVRAKLFTQQLTRLGFSAKTGDVLDVGVKFPRGGHDLSYWTKRLPEYVAWYAQCLTPKP